jgi:hypothetical protein
MERAWRFDEEEREWSCEKGRKRSASFASSAGREERHVRWASLLSFCRRRVKGRREREVHGAAPSEGLFGSLRRGYGERERCSSGSFHCFASHKLCKVEVTKVSVKEKEKEDEETRRETKKTSKGMVGGYWENRSGQPNDLRSSSLAFASSSSILEKREEEQTHLRKVRRSVDPLRVEVEVKTTLQRSMGAGQLPVRSPSLLEEITHR